ncbi:MAG TPA: 1-acyl-sn-glycerol-3-phosphate acyltransferase [Candidatus Binatia bacterium]|nr:1-acyl-sn-glycerol-3-phosphate acyltransferase [Candidatus Binatia bacterium]
MAERERPGGREPSGAATRAGDAPALRLHRGGSRRTSGGASDGVADRLTALERQVEEALGRGSERAAGPAALLRTLADAALGAVAGAGRLSFEQAVREALGAMDRALVTLAGNPAPLVRAALDALCRYWWRVEAVGLDRIPATGPVLVVANRGPALLPFEAFVVAHALAEAHPGRRDARPAVEPGLLHLPVVGRLLARLGAVRDTRAAVAAALAAGAPVVLLPEGARAAGKTLRQRYRLAGFGRAAFVRAALATGATIVPVALIGVEEADAVLARVPLPGAPCGVASLPLTPTFPWLGVAGLVPLPTKWTLHVGEPLAPAHPPSAARDAAVVARVRDQVRERLQALAQDALRRRDSVFRL